MVVCLNVLVMMNTKSEVITRILSNSHERGTGTVTHGQRPRNVSKIESVSDPVSGHIKLIRMDTINYTSTKITKCHSK
jgi:hypothetical protein